MKGPLYIGNEEEGAPASLERHLIDRSFRQAAELLEPGDIIPVALLPENARPWLASWLMEARNRLEPGDGEWHVVEEFKAADVAFVAFHVILPPLLFAFFALTAALTGCSQAPANAHPVDGQAALVAVLEQYHAATAPVPVYQVPSDCTEAGEPGWRDDGGCRGGLTLEGEGIYIVDDGQHAFWRHLPHEAKHLQGYDHPGAGRWAYDSPIGLEIIAAEKWLIDHPEIDRIEAGP